MALYVKAYIISTVPKEQATHSLYELEEPLCREMCDVNDQGDRYSKESRFIYTCNGNGSDKGIQFGTARAAVNFAIRKHFKTNFKWLKITGKNANQNGSTDRREPTYRPVVKTNGQGM